MKKGQPLFHCVCLERYESGTKPQPKRISTLQASWNYNPIFSC